MTAAVLVQLVREQCTRFGSVRQQPFAEIASVRPSLIVLVPHSPSLAETPSTGRASAVVPEHITWPGSYAQILRPRPVWTAQDLLERRFMSLVSKWIRAQLGQLRAVPANEGAEARVVLPVPDRQGGLPLMQALARRRSERAFGTEPLSPQELSNLLWAADGINRPEVHERTAPSAMNAQEIVVYVALAAGLYRYDPEHHALELVAASDARGVTGLQDFVDTAPLDLVYVADHHRMWTIPEGRRDVYAAACAGAIMQNVYLYCASAGLATVARGLFDAGAVSAALGLAQHQHVVLTQTVGWPAP